MSDLDLISPMHPDLTRQMIREYLVGDEEYAAAADERGLSGDKKGAARLAARIVPLILVAREGSLLTLSPAFVRYLDSPLSPSEIWRAALKRQDSRLAARYEAYLKLRHAGKRTGIAEDLLATRWHCTPQTVRNYTHRAEVLLVAIVQAHLLADVRKRQAEETPLALL